MPSTPKMPIATSRHFRWMQAIVSAPKGQNDILLCVLMAAHRSKQLYGILMMLSVASNAPAETKRKYQFVAGEKCEQKKNSKGEYHGEVACRESSWEGEKIESVSHYENGKKQGRREEFHWNGKPKSEEYYQNDRLEGVAKYYDDSGLLNAEKRYRAGKRNGLSKTYYNRSLG